MPRIGTMSNVAFATLLDVLRPEHRPTVACTQSRIFRLRHPPHGRAVVCYWHLADAFAASGAFIAILGSQPLIAGTLAGAVALASLLESIFKYETKARKHDELCIRFTKLAARLERLKATPRNLTIVRAERLLIEAEEPDERRLVEIMAHNEEARGRGVLESKLQPLSYLQSPPSLSLLL